MNQMVIQKLQWRSDLEANHQGLEKETKEIMQMEGI
jgi:hypothetical protein